MTMGSILLNDDDQLWCLAMFFCCCIKYTKHGRLNINVRRGKWECTEWSIHHESAFLMAEKLNWDRILGSNWDKSLKSFPPCYSQSPLLMVFTQETSSLRTLKIMPRNLPQNCTFMNSASGGYCNRTRRTTVDGSKHACTHAPIHCLHLLQLCFLVTQVWI